MTTRRTLSALGAVLAALALSAGPAFAQDEVDPQQIDEVPALSEYVEDVPTSSGPRATTRPRPRRSGGGETTPATQPEQEEPARELPRRVRNKVKREGGSLAGKLRTITTSPRFGATKRRPTHEQARFRRTRREDEVRRPPDRARALGTAVTAGFGGGDTRMTILLVTLLVTTAAAAGAAGYRHRPGGR